MVKINHIKIALLLICSNANYNFSQTVVETFAGEHGLIVESWWNKTLDEKRKFNLFKLNEADYNWDKESTKFMSYSIFGFDWINGFGPVIGSRFTEPQAVVLGGVQYTYYKKDFFVTANFTSEFKNDPNFEFYSLFQYRKSLSDKISLLGQLQSSFNFNSESHDFSFQRFRLGADFGIFQTGLAFNQTQIGNDFKYSIDPGLFFRLEFN